MINPDVLKEAREAVARSEAKNQGLKKEAFTPLTPEAQMAGAPGAMPPGAMPPGGAPPMDPAMMGGMPPMDPAMMGGAPPMDPAMMGGAPPPGLPPGMPTPVVTTMEDLTAMFREIAAEDVGAGEAGAPEAEGEPKRVTNKILMGKLEEVAQQLSALGNALGIQLPVAETGADAGTGMPAPTGPEDLAAAAAPPIPPALPGLEAAVPKVAETPKKSNALLNMISRLKKYR